MTNEHGHCPHCGADLNGGSIWDTGLEFALAGKHYEQKGVPETDIAKAEKRADEYAAAYGATRAKGRWGRQMGLTDMTLDRITEWQCPDCEHRWKR